MIPVHNYQAKIAKLERRYLIVSTIRAGLGLTSAVVLILGMYGDALIYGGLAYGLDIFTGEKALQDARKWRDYMHSMQDTDIRPPDWYS